MILQDANHQDVKNSPEVEKCRTSFKSFCERYFKHWFFSPFCQFHYDMMHLLEDLTFNQTKRKVYTAVACPRGHAKSTIVSKAYPLWLICYKHETNLVIIADTVGQAEEYLDDIKGEIEANELLIEDFGNLVGKRKWSTSRIITANGVSVVAKGTGSKIRGINKDGRRPGIFIMDDLENDEWVENPKIRKKLRSWLTKVVIPASATDGKFFVVGTILHEDSLLNNLLNDTAFNYWKRYFYQAIQKFSDSQLWDEWQNILEDDNRKDAEADAYAFYQKHRKKMLRGVEALWMDKSPDYYYDMYLQKISDPDAFSSEYQNIAIAPENQLFTAELIDDCTFEELPSPIIEVKIGVDPSLGKNNKSDLSSICAVARCENNKLYVIDIDARRRKPDQLIADTFSMAIKYKDKLSMINIESNGLQYLFYEQFVQASEKHGLYFPYNGIKTDSNKEIKIQALVPKMKQGSLKVHKKLRNLRNEMLAFPRGKTDDILDSVCLAIDGIFTTSQFCFTKLSNGFSNNSHGLPFGLRR